MNVEVDPKTQASLLPPDPDLMVSAPRGPQGQDETGVWRVTRWSACVTWAVLVTTLTVFT
jgi:hypothetical protein